MKRSPISSKKTNNKNDVSFNVNQDALLRFARIAKKVCDAYTCCIFLPAGFPEISQAQDLELYAVASDSALIKQIVYIDRLSGFTALAASQRTLIQLSFLGSEAGELEYYSEKEEIAAFLGFPISLELKNQKFTGVLTCDSKEKNCFAAPEINLLQDIATQIKLYLENLGLSTKVSASKTERIEYFFNRSTELINSLGINSVDLILTELVPLNRNLPYSELELSEAVLSFARSVQGVLPSRFPLHLLSTGKLIILSDSLMISFFQIKLEEQFKNLGVNTNEIVLKIIKGKLINISNLENLTETPFSSLEVQKMICGTIDVLIKNNADSMKTRIQLI